VTEIGSISFPNPVVQAGMGGGLSEHELAAAVTAAGGLGTVGMMNADMVKRELRQVRERTEGPVAANVLMPLARRAHWNAASTADVVVRFWGRPRRMTAKPWWHQCGSVDEALAAQRAGADAVIVQGVEAGGHVRGNEPSLAFLARARTALPAGYPVLSAGGIATAEDVRTRLDAGASAAVLGTRFLMTEESRAHTRAPADPVAAPAVRALSGAVSSAGDKRLAISATRCHAALRRGKRRPHPRHP
jgi:nitronate monooxygenase